jgi:hypothetical protein
MSQNLVQALQLTKHHAWKYIVTLNEIWFYFSNHFDRIWLPDDELPPSFRKQTIASQKLMITIIWNPREFHVMHALPKEIQWTGRYYSNNILSQISAVQDVGNRRKVIVHADNAGEYVVQCVTEYMDHNLLKKITSSSLLT